MDEPNLLSTILAAAVGAVVALVAQSYLQRHERRLRIRDLRLEAYAEWTVGIEERLRDYALQNTGGESGSSMQLCQRRLELLDPMATRLIRDVWASFPSYDTREYEELRAEFHSPDPDWQPFRASLDALLDHARRSVA